MYRGFVKLKNNETVSVIFDKDIGKITIQDKFLTFGKNAKGDRNYMINTDQIMYIEYYAETIHQ